MLCHSSCSCCSSKRHHLIQLLCAIWGQALILHKQNCLFTGCSSLISSWLFPAHDFSSLHLVACCRVVYTFFWLETEKCIQHVCKRRKNMLCKFLCMNFMLSVHRVDNFQAEGWCSLCRPPSGQTHKHWAWISLTVLVLVSALRSWTLVIRMYGPSLHSRSERCPLALSPSLHLYSYQELFRSWKRRLWVLLCTRAKKPFGCPMRGLLVAKNFACITGDTCRLERSISCTVTELQTNMYEQAYACMYGHKNICIYGHRKALVRKTFPLQSSRVFIHTRVCICCTLVILHALFLSSPRVRTVFSAICIKRAFLRAFCGPEVSSCEEVRTLSGVQCISTSHGTCKIRDSSKRFPDVAVFVLWCFLALWICMQIPPDKRFTRMDTSAARLWQVSPNDSGSLSAWTIQTKSTDVINKELCTITQNGFSTVKHQTRCPLHFSTDLCQTWLPRRRSKFWMKWCVTSKI